MTYTHKLVGDKLYEIKFEDGSATLISVAADESEIPALVDFHLNPPPPIDYASLPPSGDKVNAERDRRIESNFAFAGRPFDFDMKGKTNISGAAQLAFMAIVAGAQQGDLQWHGGLEDFEWIDSENNLMKMDAQTVVAFGQAAAAHEKAHIMAARALKDMNPIPTDYTDDKYWP